LRLPSVPQWRRRRVYALRSMLGLSLNGKLNLHKVRDEATLLQARPESPAWWHTAAWTTTALMAARHSGDDRKTQSAGRRSRSPSTKKLNLHRCANRVSQSARGKHPQVVS
jgi:hypothetical protein